MIHPVAQSPHVERRKKCLWHPWTLTVYLFARQAGPTSSLSTRWAPPVDRWFRSYTRPPLWDAQRMLNLSAEPLHTTLIRPAVLKKSCPISTQGSSSHTGNDSVSRHGLTDPFLQICG